jgi:nicotinate-nucleotide pyrophosphorylase (carboxylating)
LIEYPQIKTLPKEYLQQKIGEFLQEDAPNGDFTTLGIYDPNVSSTAIVQAEEDIVFAGAPVFEAIFGEGFTFELYCKDGDRLKKSDIFARVHGSAAELLVKERVLLNLLQRLCGIATLTSKYAEIAKPWNCKVLDTRKTTPGLRLFEKYAVAAGGGFNHRLDLSSGILIKDNHIKAAGGVTNALRMIKEKKYNLPIELEVDTFQQLEEGLIQGVDGFLLDNMTPAKVIEAVGIVRNSKNGNNIFIEASGNINLDNLHEYVKTGVNAVSVGALTHSSKAAKIHVEFE